MCRATPTEEPPPPPSPCPAGITSRWLDEGRDAEAEDGAGAGGGGEPPDGPGGDAAERGVGRFMALGSPLGADSLGGHDVEEDEEDQQEGVSPRTLINQ